MSGYTIELVFGQSIPESGLGNPVGEIKDAIQRVRGVRGTNFRVTGNEQNVVTFDAPNLDSVKESSITSIRDEVEGQIDVIELGGLIWVEFK